MISKKELLKQTGISYGQLYRWKREGLIPEEWFKKTSAPTGQETFFDEDEILPRVRKILELKDDFSIEEMRRAFAVKTGGEEIETKALFAIPECNTEIVNALAAGGTVAIHCSEEGASFRQRIPACLTTPDPDTAVVACGPEGFIQRLQSVMEEYRWSPSQFVFERFTPATENNTAAKNAFYIELASSGQRLQVAADQTIAQVLQHAGVEVMLSCEQGMCGSCITGVLDGIPEHRDSVLTAEEKAGNDQITLCCSRAKSPGLVLDL